MSVSPAITDITEAFREQAFGESNSTDAFNQRYRSLGEGGFGRLYRIPRGNGDDIAVKCIRVANDEKLRFAIKNAMTAAKSYNFSISTL